MVDTRDEASAGQEVKKDGITIQIKICSLLINTALFVIYSTTFSAHHTPLIGQHHLALEEAGTKQVDAQGSNIFSDFD